MSDKYEIEVSEFTPSSVYDRMFSIPLYQRLYAWEKEQIEQLLIDLYDTFSKSNGSQQYFIGNIVKSKADKTSGRNALIDGQQRITTFWLMGFVLKKYYSEWNKFILNDQELRLDFIARDDDRIYLKNIAIDNNNLQSNQGINPLIINAISVINVFFENTIDKTSIVEFAKYIYENAKLVEVTLPDTTDLNKYFEIMNNRGIQLEKHEILKARLLNKILNDNERIKYAIIWDACSQMNQHIERSFEKLDKNVNIKQEIKDLIKNQFKNTDIFITKISSKTSKNEKTFFEIIDEAKKENLIDIESNTPKDVNDNISSIVNFPSFLLHTYKIWRKSESTSLKDKDLLKIIEIKCEDKEQDSHDSKEFIELVLKLRILFDQYIIKSYKNGITNLWETRILPIDEDAERKKSFDNSTQILAMLNASTSIEHWLTPVLKYLHETESIEDDSFMKWLENMDNCFAYARSQSQNELMLTTNKILFENINLKPEGEIIIDETILSNGVYTNHYWFFKLDYCLWKKWTSEDINLHLKTEIRTFQFRSNRSVEHVYPQNPENKQFWNLSSLNSFGNLALISVSSNSGYNNQLPKDKKLDFQKRINNWGIESLKLVDIYKREEWNEDESVNHQKEMKQILVDYHSKKS